MMGYRVLMYAGGLVSVLVYLANLRQVRSLAREAEAGRPAPLADRDRLEASPAES